MMYKLSKGKLYVVGVGPGNHDHMTYRAKQVIEESEIIVGYDTYVSLVEDLIEGKEIYRYAMTQEVDRANQAIDFAENGKIVSLVSSGDPGIYGMIGLIYEILAEKGWTKERGMYVECVPGVSSLNSCGALVGSPLMTDFAVVSMSDSFSTVGNDSKKSRSSGNRGLCYCNLQSSQQKKNSSTKGYKGYSIKI